MNEIISHAATFLKDAGFEWAICGGSAIDLLVGRDTRPHEDLDILVFWEDRDRVITFVLDSDWLVFEACGGGQVHRLFEPQGERSERRNLYCFPASNSLCGLRPLGEDFFGFELGFEALTEFNYAEFLFNRREGGWFCYERNEAIRRPLHQAIVQVEGLSVLAPELVLLYKSSFYHHLHDDDENSRARNRRHRHDFEIALPLLNSEQRQWLRRALEIEYPNEHEWVRRLDSR